MLNKPPDQNKKPKPKTKTCKRIFLLILLAVTFALAATISVLGTRKFYSWYQTTRPLKRRNDVLFYTIVFITICMPISAFCGILIAAGYYWRKKRKYGKYEIKMRRRSKKEGRGYWLDPSDLEDKKKEADASKVNKEIENKMAEQGNTKAKGKDKTIKFQDEGHVPARRHRTLLSPFSASAELEAELMATRKYSSINPYGWFPKAEEPQAPQRQLGRSDSVKTCEDSPVVKKGVIDIWLNSFGDRASDGNNVVKGKWDEDLEMGTVRQRTM